MKKKKILIDANFPSDTRVVLLDKNNNIESLDYSSENKKQIKGNIYLAKITRIEPSLQAAFIDYGNEKNGFLPFSEIHSDYYNIPSTDKKHSTPSWSELTPPKITSDDLKEKPQTDKLIDSDEIDLSTIEKMVDEKLQSDFNIEAEEMEVEKFNKNENTQEEQKQYKIQEVIKKNQILLVQATKEERGNKGATFTSYISLAGKYCVLMPNKSNQNGISRKISNPTERQRLKKIVNSIVPTKDNELSSIIIRTAGTSHTTLDIKRDYDYLARLWNKIRETTLKSTAPCFIHQEDGLILKTIRDMFDRSVREVIVQGNATYNDCLKFMSDISPNATNMVKEYKAKVPIFTKYNVENQLTTLYQPNAQLPSGGYIVINPTEALISIDVNSGKATAERNIEEMAFKTNLEAAKEIAKQAKLRDLSGLLVIDFIDMQEVRNRKIIERSLKEFLKRDKAKIQTGHISSFGLLEMSRQRLRSSFLESNSSICEHCNGKGIIRADKPNAMLILRTIENEICNGNYDVVNVYGAASSIMYLLNNRRSEIDVIEQKYSLKIKFHIDSNINFDSYSIEKVKLSEKNKMATGTQGPALQDVSDIYNINNPSSGKKRKINNNEDKNAANNKVKEEEPTENNTPAPAPKKRTRKKKISAKTDSTKSNTNKKTDNKSVANNEENSSSLIKDFMGKIAS